jgi:glycosyltransferase involved in cell wall biosynthesis
LKKLISILIPTFNRLDYLRRSLQSIGQQDFRDFEVIISDDSTTDDIEKFINSTSFSFTLFYRRNYPIIGTPRNWTAGLDLASGDWIKILHDDDWLYDRDSLQLYVNAIHSNVDLIFGGFKTVFEDGGNERSHLISDRYFTRIVRTPNLLFTKNVLGPPSTFMYRRTMEEGFDSRLKWIVDWEGYIRMIQRYQAVFVNSILVCVSYNASQVTRSCKNIPEIEIPETLIFYQKQGFQTRSSLLLYDAWWRLIRNLNIRSALELTTYADGNDVPSFLFKVVDHQQWIPVSWWKFGLISKTGMLISYILNR